MPKYQIKTYNSISPVGLDRFGTDYEVGPAVSNPDAVMLRSFDLHEEPIAESVLAVARAGAGVNNIPIDKMTSRGIVVFNTPGANASAVKELVLAGMLMAARNLPQALKYTEQLSGENLKESVEAGKKQFAGFELAGKTLGIIGLGAIGRQVARSAIDLGMEVIGYDPALPSPASDLPVELKRSKNLKYLLENSDFVTIHVPLVEATKNLINAERIALMKTRAVLLNFSRDQIVEEQSVLSALEAKKLSYYVTDFPNREVLGNPRIIALPHLGASTSEAEDNCAVMAANQIQNYLQNGTIQFSVNLPSVELERKPGVRLTLIHDNKPSMIAQITSILSEAGQNISGLANGSRGEIAYSIFDIDTSKIESKLVDEISHVAGLIRVRVIS